MILFNSTTDLLSLVSSGTSALDVQASCMDINPSNSNRPTGYIKNTAIVTATTTVIVAAPAIDILRTLQTMSVRNKGVGTQVVTITHTGGGITAEIIEATLAPDTSLQYHENAGWWVTDTQGRAININQQNAGSPIVDADTIVRLTADVTNANATANTIADVTGLSFPVTAGKMYHFAFRIAYTAAATTTGSRWGINGPTFTFLDFISEYSLTTTTSTRNALIQAYDSPAASNASSATTGNNWAFIEGIILPSASGSVIARFASEISASAIVAKAESFVRYRQITP